MSETVGRRVPMEAFGGAMTSAARLGWTGVVAIILLIAPAANAGRLVGVTDFTLLEQHRDLGLEFVFQSAETSPSGAPRVRAEAEVESTDPSLHANRLRLERIEHIGGFVLRTPAGPISLVDFALVRISSDYDFQMVDTEGRVWIEVSSPHYQRPAGGLLITDATLRVGRALAAHLGIPALEGFMLGELDIDLQDPDADLRESTSLPSALAGGTTPPFGCGDSYGPPVDVELSELSGLGQRARAGGRVALAPRAELMNVGPNVVDWGRSMPGGPGADLSSPRGEPGWIGPHPNLVLHLYRRQGNVIEQIGLSDVKHAFLSINTGCDSATCQGGQLLGLGCGDVYGPGNNSNPLYFGPREEVSAFTVAWNSTGSHFDVDGDDFYSHPTAAHPETDVFEHRLVVDEADLQTAGARYYAEGWYLVAGDTNIFNSMAHVEVTPSLVGSSWIFAAVGSGGSTQGSILDAVVDPDALLSNQSSQIFDTGAGRVHVTGIATDNGDSTFTYEYALMNFDYDAQVQTFRVPLAAGAVANNLMFRGNGEVPGPEWIATITADAVTWQAPPGSALDWGRLVSFSVVVNRSPVPSIAVLSALETSDDHSVGVVGTSARAPNDDPTMAAPAPSGTTFGTLAGAGAEGSGVSTVADGQPDVWYSYTSPANGSLRVHTCGSFALSGVDTGLSIHSAVPGTTGNELAANDDFPAGAADLPTTCSSAGQSVDSLIDLDVAQGQSVFIRVAAASGPAGSFQLTVVPPTALNDDAANSELIGGPGSLTATLDGATPDGSSASSPGTTPDLWYHFTAASAGTLIFDTCGSFALEGTDTLLSVHSSVPGTTLNQLGENDDSPFFDLFSLGASPTTTACDPDGGNNLDSAVAVNVSAGQTVWVRVTNFADPSGAFVLNTTGPGPPAVSLVARTAFDTFPRLELGFNNYFFEGEFVDFFWGSTGDSCNATGSWSGSRPTGSEQTEFMALHDGGPYTLTCSGPVGMASETLRLRVDPIAVNDSCVNATSRVPPFSESVSGFFAGIDIDERVPTCALDGASLWYEVVPNVSGTLALSTFGSNYDTVLSVWDGEFDPCDEFSALELTCNDDALDLQSRVVLQVTAGQPLIVRVAAFGEFDPEDATAPFENPDQLSFDATFITPLVNDACTDATDVIAPVDGEVMRFATTSDATVESDEPASSCGFEEATVWYRVVATTDQLVNFSTDGSAYDTVLAVYDGSEMCGAIQTELGCNDDHNGLLTSEVTLPATAGQVFLVRVSAFPTVFPTELVLTIPEPSAALQGSIALGLLVGLRVRRKRGPTPSQSPCSNNTNKLTPNRESKFRKFSP